MKNKKNIFIIILASLALLFAGCNGSTSLGNGETSTGNEGRVVFTITDAAADMENVNEVRATINNVELYSESSGWVQVSSEAQTYNLLQLGEENRAALVADERVESSQYSQMRFDIEEVTVITADGNSREATMPSEEMQMDIQADVNSNNTAVIKLDILVDKSLHETEEGDYVMAPVVMVESREDVEVDTNNTANVIVEGGAITTAQTYGMDVEGNVDIGVQIPADAEITLGVLNDIQIGPDSGITGDIGANIGIGDDENNSEDANSSVRANSSSKTTVNSDSGDTSVNSESEGSVGIY